MCVCVRGIEGGTDVGTRRLLSETGQYISLQMGAQPPEALRSPPSSPDSIPQPSNAQAAELSQEDL